MKYLHERLKLTDREMFLHVMFETGLSESEIEIVIGGKHRKRYFEAVIYSDGSAEIRNKKTKKIAWRT